MVKMIRVIWLCMLLSCHNPIDDIHNLTDGKVLSFNMGISFPPISNVEQRTFSAPLLKDLNVQSIRLGENWKFRESNEGTFNWNPLDQRIEWAKNNGLEILLTIQSNGPDWACSNQKNDNSCVFADNAKFKHYIEQLLQRFPNRISKIQFGNEWQSSFWYIGNELEFVKANNIVYQAIQQYSPNTTFVLGGFTASSLRFLAGCNSMIHQFYDDSGKLYILNDISLLCESPEILNIIDRINFVLDNAYYDEVDIHLYDDAENWPIYYEYISSIVDKPIFISEFGGPNINIESITEEYQSQRLKTYIETIEKLPVEESYYFKLVEGSDNPAHRESGLINYPNLTKKLSYFTFRDLNIH